MIWDTVAAAVLKIIDKVIPDPAAKAAAQLQVLQLKDSQEARQLDADLRLALGQTDINKIDAASNDKFASRWRPAVGWVCVVALCYKYLACALLTWVCLNLHLIAPPQLDVGDVLALLPALLGFGAYRSFDKLKGTS